MELKKQNNFRPWLIIALIGLVVLSFYKMNVGAVLPREFTVVEFWAALSKGEIAEPVFRIIDHEQGSTYLEGDFNIKDSEKQEGGALKTKRPSARWRVYLVPGENEKLMNELQKRGVRVRVRNEVGAISPFVMNILFFVGMVFLFYWFIGKKMGGEGGPFGMGKSRAKVFTGKEDRKRVTFSDVAGIDEAREEVQEIVEFLKKPDDFRKLGGRIPKGILLVGPPGTGKTLLARAIAGEAGVPFFAISGSDFEEMFVGVGASRMRDMFAEAKRRAPCIVFIDEIDSIGMKRTGAGAIGGSHAYEQTLNTMLVEMDGFDANEGVIVIAATNRPDTLDSALLRPGRFDRQVVVELPTLKGREEILRLHGKKIKFAADADLSRVARGTPGFSGADLANLLNEAALLAVREKLDAVDMKTLEEARDKVLWGRERKSAGYSQKERETTAWHEAGHAILQVLVKDADPLHKVTIIPRGRALGATMALPEKDVLNKTRRQFLAEMRICCGGRIAEEMNTKDISTGASMDIRQATAIARDMICKYGMSDKFGFQAFLEPSQFTGAELSPAFSEQTSREIDEEVKRLVDEAYADAKRLISENQAKLEQIAKLLIEKETVDGREIEEIVKGTEQGE